MRTAHECLLKADNCERNARACADPIDRGMMLVAAQHWLNLAGAAELAELRRTQGEIASRTTATSGQIH